MDDIKTIGVAGCGIIGSGIAQVVAAAGYATVMREVTDEALKIGTTRIKRFVESAVNKKVIELAVGDAMLARIKTTLKLGDMENCDIVIEAAPENIRLKKEIFTDLDVICGKDCILASTTSTYSIAELAGATNRPDKVVGLHFFNPVPVVRLVEIVKTFDTSESALRRVRSFVESLGKTAVSVKDSPGFVVNRLLIPYLLDAIRLYEAGVASLDDIDTAVKQGCQHPSGPLQLADSMGLDVVLSLADTLYEEFREQRYAAPPLLRHMVAAGKLGRKSGKGFYNYEKAQP